MTRTRWFLIVTLVLGGLLLVPVGHADHALAHRYVVEGRVLDADGDPVVNLTVPYGRTGFPRDAWCEGTGSDGGYTDADGWFSYCVVTGALEGWMDVRVDIAGEVHIQHVDTDLRRSTFLVRTDGDEGEPRAANVTDPYTVSGTLWQGTAPGYRDGIPVDGVPVANETVRVTLVDDANATLGAVNATTDRYGGYAVNVTVGPDATPARVLVDARNDTRTFEADTTFNYTRADVVWPGNDPHPDLEPRTPPARGKPPVQPAADAPPGTVTPAFWGSGAFFFTAAVAAGAVAGVAAYYRRRYGS